MGGVTGNIGGAVKGLGLGNIGVSLEKVLQGRDQRAAFNAILLATVAHGSKKPNFSLELEINDLMVRLGNLRSMSSVSGVFGNLGVLLQDVDSSMKSLIK